MKKFFSFLLYVFIILLIAGIVFGVAILLGKPLQQAAVVFGLILGIWLLYALIKKTDNQAACKSTGSACTAKRRCDRRRRVRPVT